MRTLSVIAITVLVLIPMASVGQTEIGAPSRVQTPGMETGDTPAVLDGANVLTANQLKDLINGKSAVIFDMRKKISYLEGHIPTARNGAAAYDRHAKKVDVDILGADKSAPIVFYSHGPDGWKSYWSARTAVEAGYSNILWFRGGFARWTEGKFPFER